jgi:Domain of unknown function (DUF4160)
MRVKGVAGATSKMGSAVPDFPQQSEAEGQAHFDMANLRPERTGLPFVVFISQKGGAKHDIRVKIARAAKVRPSEMVTVALRPSVRVVRGTLDPRDLALLRRWIELNRDVLIAYWDGIIEYTEDAIDTIRSIQQED